jgi:inosine/xanthosine triphosphate pyrophosphatase family protein
MLSMSESVLIATTNPAKSERLRWVLSDLGLEFRPLQAGTIPPPEENGADFRANAELKARYWSEQLGGVAAASDGGLVIPALGPRWNALQTARAAGPGADDIARANHLIALTSDLKGDQRTVFWREALAIAEDGKLLASWDSQGTRAQLVEAFEPGDLKPGFWAASLCRVPESGRTLAALGDAQLPEHDPTWTGLRQAVKAWLGEHPMVLARA